MPPVWSFGTWMSRMSYFSADEVRTVATRLREGGFPCDVLHIDTGWFPKDWVCEWKFSPERFPDPAGFLREFMQYEPEPLIALVGFNAGVELGQLAFVVPAAFALRLLFRGRDDAERDPDAPPESLAPRRLRLVASVVICALALYWFARRAWFP